MENITKEINWIVKNWDKIPDKYKWNLEKKYDFCNEVMGKKVAELPEEEYLVVRVLDRQRPSVEASYDFDEERIFISHTGKVIWGFDSGCSCSSPWVDSYPDRYKVSKNWKQFEVNLKDFDRDVIEDVLKKINEIKNAVL